MVPGDRQPDCALPLVVDVEEDDDERIVGIGGGWNRLAASDVASVDVVDDADVDAAAVDAVFDDEVFFDDVNVARASSADAARPTACNIT
jgi:hypothetical protein